MLETKACEKGVEGQDLNAGSMIFNLLRCHLRILVRGGM